MSMIITTVGYASNFLLHENKGQFKEQVLFKANLNYGAVFVEKNKLTFVLHNKEQLDHLKDQIHNHQGAQKDGHEHHEFNNKHHSKTDLNTALLFDSYSFSITFDGANKNSSSKGSNPVTEHFNYNIGTDESRWASEVNGFQDLWITNLYDGIDFHLYAQGENLKYDFIVHPNADPNQIKLKYKGQESIQLIHGKVYIKTSVGTLVDEDLMSFTRRTSINTDTQSQYTLKDEKLSFNIGTYNQEDTLVIDPVLNFSSFTGSTIDNWGFTATYDNDENSYAAGIAFGTGYPISTGAYQSSFGGGNPGPYGAYPIDITISKFSANGNQLVYSSYLGGSGQECPHSLVVTNDNELVLFGTTSSLDYPTTANAFDKTFNGGTPQLVDNVIQVNGTDIVVTKFSADGSTLVGSTYYGGSANDGYNDESRTNGLYHNYSDIFRGEIITDSNGNTYVATTTASSNLPIVNGFQNSFGGGGQDGCVFKLNTDFSQVVWSSYLGGADADAVYALQANSTGDMYVTGGTKSTNFPVSGTAVQNPLSGGIDGFVAKISSDGTTLLNSTFIGSSNYEQGYFVQVDNDDKVYVLGQTDGSLGVTPGVYSNANGRLFIHKYNTDLSTLELSTLVGNTSISTTVSPSAFLVDNCGKIYLSGWGGESNQGYGGGSTTGLPTTSDAFQSTTDGSDFYIMVLEKDFAALSYGTFFGSFGTGEHVDGGTSRFSKNGTIYQAVCAACGNGGSFPVTAGAYSETNNAVNCNLAIFKFDVSKLNAKINPVTDTLVCQSDTVRFYNESIGGTSVQWLFHDGTSSTLNDTWKIFTTPGTYPVSLIINDPSQCPGSDTTTTYFTVQEFITPTLVAADSVICEGNNTTIVMSDNDNYSWFEGNQKINLFQNSFSISPDTATVIYIAHATSTCSDTLAIPITVIKQPVGGTEISSMCYGDTASFVIPQQADFNYSFSPTTNIHTSGDSVFFYPTDTVLYTLTITGDCGIATIDYQINTAIVSPIVSPDTTICVGGSAVLQASGGSSYSWSPAISLTNPNSDQALFTGDTSTVFTVTVTENNCFATKSILVSVLNNNLPSSATHPLSLCMGDTIVLPFDENQNYTYSWSTTVGMHIALDSIYFHPAASTNFELTITGACGTAVVNYETDVTNIIATTTPDSTICRGDTITLTTSGASSYVWSPSIKLDAQFGNTSTFISDSTTSFIVQLNENNCSINDTINITVLAPRPKNNIHADHLCDNETSTLPFQIQNDFTYIWTPSTGVTVVNDSVKFSPLVSTNYLLNITGECASAEVLYEIDVTNIPSTISPDTSICPNEILTLNATGGTSYSWSPANALDRSDTSTVIFTADTTTTFTTTVSSGTCSKEEKITVTVLGPAPTNAIYTPNLCEGESVTLPLQTQQDYVYTWTPSTPTVTSDSVVFNDISSTNYTVTITGECGVSTVNYEVNVTNLRPYVQPTITACKGDSITLFSSGGTNYEWSPSTGISNPLSATPKLLVGDISEYSVLISENECSAEMNVSINAFKKNDQGAEPEYTIQFGETQGIDLLPEYDYQWSPGTYLNCASTNCSSIVSEPLEDITYLYTYTDENQCVIRDSVKINVIFELYIPNAFTPGSGSLNNVFYAYSHLLQDFHMEIFDRWGEKIFESNDINTGWDGTYKGKPAQMEVYVWKIWYTKIHTSKEITQVGTVTLVR